MKEKIKNYQGRFIKTIKNQNNNKYFVLSFFLILLGVFLIGCNGIIQELDTYTVIYHGNGSTGGTVPADPSSPYEYGATVTVLDKGDLVKTGYTFAGWDTAADGSGTDHAVGSTFIMGASNVTLYAKWTINFDISSYTVTFDSQGGSAVAPQTVEHGELVTEPTDPTRASHTFGGWYKESGCTNAWDFATDTVTAGVTLYAKWTLNFDIYIVFFDSQGGSIVGSQVVEYGGLVTEPTDPTRPSYTFGGWYKESGCTNAWDFATDTVTANVTLYAKWTPLYALRDTGPSGGLIFYVKEDGYSDGWMYLEAASCDLSSGISWGCYGTSIPGADGTAVGTGKQNTIDIVAECATVNIAAELSATLNWGGYSDWFLPSKDELNQMYVNLKVYGVGDFTDAYYWSSSQYYPHFAQYAWTQYFYNGGQSSHSKHTFLRARAIRAF